VEATRANECPSILEFGTAASSGRHAAAAASAVMICPGTAHMLYGVRLGWRGRCNFHYYNNSYRALWNGKRKLSMLTAWLLFTLCIPIPPLMPSNPPFPLPPAGPLRASSPTMFIYPSSPLPKQTLEPTARPGQGRPLPSISTISPKAWRS
jgi:hypothetical protein